MKIAFVCKENACRSQIAEAWAGKMWSCSDVEFVTPEPASEAEIAAAHTKTHVDYVRENDHYSIAALAAGGAIQAARIGLEEPAFGLIRPPGVTTHPPTVPGDSVISTMLPQEPPMLSR